MLILICILLATNQMLSGMDNKQVLLLTEQIESAVAPIRKTNPNEPIYVNANVIINENSQTNLVNIFDYPRKLLTDGKEKFSGSITTVCEYIKNNKKSLFWQACIACVAAAQLRLWQLKIKLKMGKLWSQSQSEKPIEELYQIPPKTLGFKLLGEIQKVYMQLDNPTNFVGPLISFIKDTEREKAILEEYKTIVNWADKLYLKKLLFYDAVLLESIPDRLNKLAYLKNSFLNWLAEFKAAHPQEFLHKKRKSGSDTASGFTLSRNIYF